MRAIFNTQVIKGISIAGIVVRDLVKNGLSILGLPEYLSMYHRTDSYKTIDDTGLKTVTTVGTPPISTWERGSSMSFSMTNYLNFGQQMQIGTQSFTVGAWVKFADTGGVQNIAGRAVGSSVIGRYTMLVEIHIIKVFYQAGSEHILTTSVTPYKDGQWHHVAMVANRTTGRFSLFIDFIEKAFRSIPQDIINLSHPGNFYVGVYGDAAGTGVLPNSYFKGQISQVFHSNEALTVEQLQEVANVY